MWRVPDSAKTFESVQLQHAGETLTFAVLRSVQRKTCAVVLDGRGVYVAAPMSQPLPSIAEALAPKLPVILERDSRFRALQGRPTRPRQFVSGESLRLLGRPYLLRVVDGDQCGVELRGTRVFVTARDRYDVQAALEEWFKEKAIAIFTERVAYWAQRLGVTHGEVLLRSQKTRWGSCDRSGNLRLNWRLVMAPMSLIDYVLAHELAHLRVPDHSPAFWSVLRGVMPDYQARRSQLDRDGAQFTLD
ncbi:SprT family zinc-dependent metalloprotease [Deinococcus soli (ex Cha et al. 2016)]|uniref:M48 family metallopeptidase n=1 Tax=Deinococcus soli (ex Cha et al. 2016) TaxID=1309411 RepID=UPI00286A240C|nr:SprT family zinc-dependent metalloprotease [Deinococcus soli (ex Cha et al. 2016)]